MFFKNLTEAKKRGIIGKNMKGMTMPFLYFLESIRTPVGNFLMSNITRFGEEALFIVLALLFLWCIDKREGYYLLAVGFCGLLLNQFLKILCRVPRPWVKHPDFTIVEGSATEATGYSFPSGHTQTAVGAYGAVARWEKKTWLRILLSVLCFLVALSRMYLGVHTPLDVCVSIGIALLLIFMLYPFFKALDEHPYRLFYFLGALFVLSLLFVLYVELAVFPADVDVHNLDSAVKGAYTLLGSLVGFALIYFLDVRFYHYETKAPLFAQALKLIFGAALAVAVKSLLKAPLNALFLDHHVADSVRYFLLFAIAGGLWPLTFPYFTRFAEYLKRKCFSPK